MKLRILVAALTLVTGSALVLSIPTAGQQSSPSSASLADAARAAQAQKPSSGTPPKVITNDDLAPQSAVAGPAAAAPQGAQAQSNATVAPQTQSSEPAKSQPVAAPAASEQSGGCHNPKGDEAIEAELQAAQDELEQLRRDLAENPMAIPNQNVDMTNFKPGGSGVDLGSPPLSDAQPQSPDRIKEVMLEQKIASLKRAAVVTCDSAENGEIQRKIDEAQKQLALAQRELDLDSSTYYSNPNYAQDAAGKAKIDGEQEQVQSLQSEIDSLKQELAAAKSN
jgi:hypothetical protein